MDRDPVTTSAPPAEKSFFRDLLLGMGYGIGLAVFWVIVAFLLLMANHDKRHSNRGGRTWDAEFVGGMKSLLVIAGIALCVALGALAGNWLGGKPGILFGGLAGYLLPFMGFAIGIQRKMGFAAWVDSLSQPPR